jgi:eukaryotic-like serine/threonine-protein kinase
MSSPSAVPTSPSERFSLAEGTVLGDRFVVTAPIAAGAQGEVYRAEDRDVRGHVVAVKVMRYPSNSEVEREVALRELELLAAVRHPSVLQFLDHGWIGGRLWYAMPWLVGETLEDKRLGRAEAQSIFEKLAAGLHALHSVGIRHQDIKPANIFLARIDGYDESMPILLDLGVAVRKGESLAAGSLGYFAPEVAGSWPRPNPALDGKADVFALALTLREVLEPDSLPPLPDSEGGVPAYLVKRASEAIPPPSRPGLRYLKRHFASWLHVDPSRRPDADAFRKQLFVLTEPERKRKRMARIFVIASILSALLAYGAHQTLRAQELRRESEAHALAAATRTEEADEAKTRARIALEEAERADAAAAEARRHASDSSEEAERAKELSRQAEEAARRAREAEQESLLTALSAREARSAAELARRAAERQVASADVERARLTAELAAAREEQARLSNALGEANVAVTDARTSLAQTRTSLAEARASLTEALAATETAQTARRALEAEVESLRAGVRALEARLAAIETPPGEAEPAPPTAEATEQRRARSQARPRTP